MELNGAQIRPPGTKTSNVRVRSTLLSHERLLPWTQDVRRKMETDVKIDNNKIKDEAEKQMWEVWEHFTVKPI